MTEVAIAPHGDLPPPSEPPGTVQRAFNDFVDDIHDEYTARDVKALRFTRKPRSTQQEPQPVRGQSPDDLSDLLDTISKNVHEETVEYFYPVTRHGKIDFEHSAEVNFNVDGAKAEFSSILLHEPVPEGAQFSLRILERPGELGPQEFVEVDGALISDLDMSFSIIYDLKTGKLRWARLQKTDGSRMEERRFDDSEPHPNSSNRDKAVGESISMRIAPDATLLIRMPRQQNFAEIIRAAFPQEIFRHPFVTTKGQDATWRGMNWVNGSLGVTLSRNGQPVAFPL